MVFFMDALFEGFPISMDGLKFNPNPISLRSDQDFVKETKTHHGNFETELRQSSEGCSPSDSDSYNATLKFISEMLMEEEDLERKSLMLKDSLALQAAEKSFYDVLSQNYPSSSSSTSSVDQNPGLSESCSFQTSFSGSSVDTLLVQDSNSEVQSVVSKFRGKIREERSFFPKGKPQISERDIFEYNLMNGKKNNQRERDYDDQEEGRRNKQSAVFGDDSEPTEMFDKVLLYDGDNDEPNPLYKCSLNGGSAEKLQHNEQAKRSGKSSRSKKQENKAEMVDLWTLLTQCAQAVAGYDQRTAANLLKQIRQHSSPKGDSTQRLAHYFADGLEARLTGTRTALYSPLVSNEMSSTDILKGHRVYISACPFQRMSFSFANQTIRKLAQNATKIHIIDFGILYGFQWPGLIQRLSRSPGGPPKLRITGIELPQPGFRPFERVGETKRRLENYCKRFNVPSQFNVIAKKWETISYEDLNIERDELVVVNCMYRMKHIPDETVVVRNPRDTVLKLIRRINPALFIHGVCSGTYNAPFFASRFREALFHYSSMFDMFETTVPREDEYRMLFEKAIYGRDIVNVIACEGLERVERPETYKQWQVRNTRAGFKQVPIDQEIFKQVRNTVNSSYNKDFVVEQHGQWLIQGWKGRRTYAISCWKPV